MQVNKSQLNDTTIKLSIEADQELLETVKRDVLSKLRREVKIPGFRAGKVPLELVEKNVDQTVLQNQFIDAALNKMYSQALAEQAIRPVAQPTVNIKKFVPFTTLEFEAEIESIGAVTVADYKSIRLAQQPIKITDSDIDEVIQNLRLRMAEKAIVDRPAHDTDEIWIDFEGRDAVSGDPIKGGDGKDYPLVLGSNTFIPGFEKHLLGVSKDEEREFTLDFPADYAVKTLQSKKVVFKVLTKKINEVTLPPKDDDFAAKIGPFKSYKELVADISKQLATERETKNLRDYESDLLSTITGKSAVAVPNALIDEELNRLEQEERQNVSYRGQTWEEHLAAEGVSEDQHRANNRAGAELRVKAGLVLAEIADAEKVEITPDEFDIRVQLLKGQYQDPAMQSEIDKPENRRELASRMLSEKTIAILVSYASKQPDTPKASKVAAIPPKKK